MQSAEECKYRSILVPLDGSESAEHALPTALSLARRHGAALRLVRVYVPVAGMEGEYAVRYDEALDRELMKRAQDYLDGVVARMAADAGIQSSSALLEGSIADAISQHATADGTDLLVMTTQGRGPLARFWLGSVSDKLVRHAGVPILFVRPKPTAVDFVHEPACRRVLIPLDGSTLAERVLEPALALGTGGTQYTLLRIVAPITELNYGPAGGTITGLQESLKQFRGLEKQELERAHDYLERVACPLRARAFAVDTRVAWNDRPAAAILDDASVHSVDLIALATYGWGGLKRLMLGSVADKLLRGAETAVLVYRPADESAPAER